MGLFGSKQDTSDDERRDRSYSPPHNTRERGEGRPQEYLDTMDGLLELSFKIRQQMTPQEVVARVQQQQDEEQLRERDVSRMKVEEWRRTILESSSAESSNSQFAQRRE
jgi:hypothetical protein